MVRPGGTTPFSHEEVARRMACPICGRHYVRRRLRAHAMVWIVTLMVVLFWTEMLFPDVVGFRGSLMIAMLLIVIVAGPTRPMKYDYAPKK